jgi:hypothetical protein
LLRPVQVFHYHLVTSKVRLVEARYIGRLGFDLVARYGWVNENSHCFEQGIAWNELDAMKFRLRLVELSRGAVNVVLQPGHWNRPRLDHLGIALDEDGYTAALERASDLELKIQDHRSEQTFIATGAGYRLEIHPPRDWIEATLERSGEMRLAEIHLRARDPEEKAAALAEVFQLPRDDHQVRVGDTLVRFVPDGPEGRPELVAEVLA